MVSKRAGTEVEKWADEAMYYAPEAIQRVEDDSATGPTVRLVSMTTDPLRTMAAAAELYRGIPWGDPGDIDAKVAREWFRDMTKTRLQAPLEFIDLHFLFENVTRAFTHQLVRQRTAVYVQESQRFAVKGDARWAVGMPPSIAGLKDDDPRMVIWNDSVNEQGKAYLRLVNAGIPAEDARGLLPTNILTKVHYKTNLRNLAEHAGNRLCTQAQFEWRQVWAGIVQAIRNRPRHVDRRGLQVELHNQWQYDLIADMFKPICYATGKCEFQAATDRYCSIRERVGVMEQFGIPSSEWANSQGPGGRKVLPIFPREWLADPAAARRAPGSREE